MNSAAISSSNKTSRAQKEQFDWPMPLNIATQVAGKVLHCATWEKFLATLRNALRKVELNSTSRNDCGNRKIATNDCSRVCYTRQYFVQLVSQQNCDKLQEKLPSVTAPLERETSENKAIFTASLVANSKLKMAQT